MLVDTSAARCFFPKALPASRLGREHASLKDFRAAINFTPSTQREYTLIVVTEFGSKRILIGQKHRGFGNGMYNSFGGKIEAGESIAAGAVRELHEETGICVTNVDSMARSRVGTMHFSFDDNTMEMVVHVFRINIRIGGDCVDEMTIPSDNPLVFPVKDTSVIRGCEEITPFWFDDWNNIPLDNMFADGSVWLTNLLTSVSPMHMDGWFHFEPGGQEKNTIMSYYIDIRPTPKPF